MAELIYEGLQIKNRPNGLGDLGGLGSQSDLVVLDGRGDLGGLDELSEPWGLGDLSGFG